MIRDDAAAAERELERCAGSTVRSRSAAAALRRATRLAAGAATLLALIALWQAGASAGLISTLFLPAPVSIARALWPLTVSGELWRNLSALADAAGDRLDRRHHVRHRHGLRGRAVGRWRARRAMAVVSALFPIPKIALVPLFIIWFGIGEGSKMVDPRLRRVLPDRDRHRGRRRQRAARPDPHGPELRPVALARSFARSCCRARCRRSSAASASPTSIAIVLLVAAEMIGAERGIGAFVLSGGQSLRHRQSAGRHRRAVAARPASPGSSAAWSGCCCAGVERWMHAEWPIRSDGGDTRNEALHRDARHRDQHLLPDPHRPRRLPHAQIFRDDGSRHPPVLGNIPLIEWRRLGEADGHEVVESICRLRAAGRHHPARRLRGAARRHPGRSARGDAGRCRAAVHARRDGRRRLRRLRGRHAGARARDRRPGRARSASSSTCTAT